MKVISPKALLTACFPTNILNGSRRSLWQEWYDGH